MNLIHLFLELDPLVLKLDPLVLELDPLVLELDPLVLELDPLASAFGLDSGGEVRNQLFKLAPHVSFRKGEGDPACAALLHNWRLY